MEALLGTPRSRAVLDQIARLRGDVLFALKWSAGGTFHKTGEIWLDRKENEQSWIAHTAHEIVHLHTFLAGKAADISTMTRADFVNAKMFDEINAHAAGYVTLLQTGVASSTLKGFNDLKLHLARAKPNAVKDKKWADIEALAKTWVEDKYRNDASWLTSNTNENYYVYWGRAWDAAHPSGTTP
jgi:hypothetical protein